MGAYVRDARRRRPADGASTGDEVGLLFDTGHTDVRRRRPGRRCCGKHVARVVPRALQGRAARRDPAGAQPRLELPARRCSTAPSPCPATARSTSPRCSAIAARPRLPRLAGRRGRAGSGGRAELRVRGEGLPDAARRSSTRCGRRARSGWRDEPAMSLLVKAATRGRDIVDVTPAIGRLALRRLSRATGWRAGERTAHRRCAGRELCIVVAVGPRRRDAGAATRATISAIATSVFDDRAPVRGLRCPTAPAVDDDRARRRAEIGVAHARPAAARLPPRLIEPATMQRTRARRRAATRATCATSCRETEPAEHLLVVEVRTPSGHSSSYPPHKHDTDAAPRRDAARGDLLPPARPAAGLRVPARLHRRPLARRVAGRRGPRRRDGAARLPPGGRAARLRVVLPERDGRAEARLAFPQRPGARMDARSADAGRAARRRGAARRRRCRRAAGRPRCSRASPPSTRRCRASSRASRATSSSTVRASMVDRIGDVARECARAAVGGGALRAALRLFAGFSAMQAVFRDDYTQQAAPSADATSSASGGWSTSKRRVADARRGGARVRRGEHRRPRASWRATSTTRRSPPPWRCSRAREHIYVVGVRRSYAVAAYMTYALQHIDKRVQLVDGVGGMVHGADALDRSATTSSSPSASRRTARRRRRACATRRSAARSRW